jgi:hypothetical protein
MNFLTHFMQNMFSEVFQKSNMIIPVINGSPSPRNDASSVCGWRNDLQYGGIVNFATSKI